ncbi:Hypothetical predicted protein [Paramuricea clavata]|uniref:Uncharacterized protein n=1 Tax=Paramuricea clavata TaxID=317549 RepID=A0A6S7JE16_PARCT|nr:Hypothetical predicted protein [Paramuricea clavata]
MGACPSAEYFHDAINLVMKEIPDCQNISDNIWLLSKNKKEHLKQLDQLLGTLEGNGISLKFAKCSFAVQQISVLGHIVSNKGIQPDKKNVEAVADASKPKSAAEVRSFLGLACELLFKIYPRLQFVGDRSSPIRAYLQAKVDESWKASASRIERWLLRLRKYNIDVMYQPGVQHLADHLSHLPTKTPWSNMEACGDRFVHYLAEQNTPVFMSTKEIRETADVDHDPETKQIRESIINIQRYKLPQDYKLVGDDLSITKDIVLRRNRIVLPAKL